MANATKLQIGTKRSPGNWKRDLEFYQGSTRTRTTVQTPDEKPEKIKEQWCPILKHWSSQGEERIAAHIIPFFKGYENVAWQLGDHGDYAAGKSHIWHLRNGLMMSKSFEERCDKGELVIVPIDTPSNKPQRLKIRILDPALMNQPISETPERTYGSYDGEELEFIGKGRPGLRYLYWHYVTSVLRMMAYGDADDIKRKCPGSKMWASAGSYFRKSTLKPMAKYIGDYEVAEGDFQEGLFDGVGHKSEESENAMAAEVAHFLENYKEEEKQQDADSDDDSSSESDSETSESETDD